MSYIPNKEKDRAKMMEYIGISSVDELFDDIPQESRLKSELDLPKPLTEIEVKKTMRNISNLNADTDKYTFFLGAGAYKHFIPSVVNHITRRSEFYTAYTPYQAEASQGSLQVIYEYQSMICNLMGMDIANASMYDGATAMAEAANLAVHFTGRKKILVSKNVHPNYRRVLKTYANGAEFEVVEINYNENGQTQIGGLSHDVACLIVSNPNFFGSIEDLTTLSAETKKHGALFIVSVDPISLGLLKNPGQCGADIVVGEGQCLGTPLSFGGPYLGLFAAKSNLLRFMPGRIAGKTTDHNGREGYVLTMQTREQHIRRERATSNICSNEALVALAASVYLSFLGDDGLKSIAKDCYNKSNYLKEKISKIPGYSIAFNSDSFKEFAVKVPIVPKTINAKLFKKGIIGGLDLGGFYPELKDHMLFCVTEVVSKEEIDNLAQILASLQIPHI